MTDLLAEPDGATPLDEEDTQGLRRRTLAHLLTRAAMKELHRRMFGDVWRWAGTTRRRQTNIGSPPYRIVTDLADLLLDVQTQTVNPARLAWPADEIAVRFHHRLVSIHPFPNGNGRHARLAADLVVVGLVQRRLTWGSAGDLTDDTATRARYLAALRLADREHAYEALLEFARS